MIKKILSITDEQLAKKSSLYTYLFSVVLGGLFTIVGIVIFFFHFSDTHKKMIHEDSRYIEYLEKVYDQVNDENLLYIIDSYKTNANLIHELPELIGYFLFFLGVTLLANFFLFLELRKKSIKRKIE
jgi:hypothetical protein